jgi:hypothetical protein
MRNNIAIAPSVALVAIFLAIPTRVLAQRVVPKIGSICPLGYVDKLNGKCTTFGLTKYTVRPTYGRACLSGWMNVGGGYCRKKW